MRICPKYPVNPPRLLPLPVFAAVFLCVSFSIVNAQGNLTFPEQSTDETGFVSIFDGKSLEGWEGNPVYWRVEDGSIVGEITPETIVKENTFLIWRGGTPGDFELKVDVRVSPRGNSGINYRSSEISGTPYRLKGYQADIDGPNRWSGQNYEERGRTFLALRGQLTRIENSATPRVIGTIGDRDSLTQFIKTNDWNEHHLVIKDNVLIHMISGQVMSMVIDDDEVNRTDSGLIGVQVHVGPPMKIEFRNFRLKDLSELSAKTESEDRDQPRMF